MSECNTIRITVVYAMPDEQHLVALELPAHGTAIDAVILSGMEKRIPGLRVTDCKLGIYGKTIEHSHLLEDGDRVEIYRPLQVDPKTSRRLRADKARKKKL